MKTMMMNGLFLVATLGGFGLASTSSAAGANGCCGPGAACCQAGAACCQVQAQAQPGCGGAGSACCTGGAGCCG